MNPILPKNRYTPDVEARVWNDGRIYLYGSNDICANTFYCSREYRVYSSSDMKVWQDHGVSFTGNTEGPNRAVEPGILYAPDCVYKDGTYYLYYCQPNGEEGVAISNLPSGPFHDACIVDGANKTKIDPAVFIDDDGNAYYYWAQISARAGRLRSDMAGLVPESIIEGLLTEAEHGFHEGISMRKHNGIYYLVFTDISRGRATCIGYATSKSPLGPFIKQGIIIDNTGCDPKSWNNHGSIQEFNEQWYIFYHRSTHNSEFSRRVCAEPIFFDENGLIKEVEMTTQGAEAHIDPSLNMYAANACLLGGRLYIDSYSGSGEFYEYLTHIHNGDWAAFKYYLFSGNEKALYLDVSSMTTDSRISFRIDSQEGLMIAQADIGNTNGWHNFCSIEIPLTHSVSGKHALYITFSGNEGRLVNLRNFLFIS